MKNIIYNKHKISLIDKQNCIYYIIFYNDITKDIQDCDLLQIVKEFVNLIDFSKMKQNQ